MNNASAVPIWVLYSGRLAPIASIFVLMSPIPTMATIKRDRSVGNLPLLPYSSMIASTYLWCVYGLLKNEPNIWGTNCIGLALGLYYFVTFQKFTPKSSTNLPGTVHQHMQFVLLIISVATLLPLLRSVLFNIIDTTEAVGKAGVFLCIAMFASPLSALKTVLETKSAKSIPLPFTISSIINCWLWSVFGWFQMNDPNVYFPNLLGLIFGLMQLALKVYYSDSKLRKAKLKSVDEENILRMDVAI
jgi:solute carrier family 50 (sugar transporter)